MSKVNIFSSSSTELKTQQFSLKDSYKVNFMGTNRSTQRQTFETSSANAPVNNYYTKQSQSSTSPVLPTMPQPISFEASHYLYYFILFEKYWYYIFDNNHLI